MPEDPATITTILDEDATLALIGGLVDEVGDRAPDDRPMVLVGIRRRGDVIARRIAAGLAARGHAVSTGSLDITLYRDDFAQVGALPQIGASDIDVDIGGAHVVIIDDVLYTGRTIRAALNELSDFGRAAKVELCVLVDRGGRQLPIQPDYVGHALEAPEGTEVSVRVDELDGAWGVDLVTVQASR
ncbi:MAG: bifunctional pyr operon transcriptional regulator/uracil phosphoribosyltransferase PyrR [Acidobacteriota bacterium]|nr:bifunctional pyr operon transcriptional regulator/uracil phosphoribosyltransferase PyrR [Acidobacteriota bacterium]